MEVTERLSDHAIAFYSTTAVGPREFISETLEFRLLDSCEMRSHIAGADLVAVFTAKECPGFNRLLKSRPGI